MHYVVQQINAVIVRQILYLYDSSRMSIIQIDLTLYVNCPSVTNDRASY